MRVKNCYLTVRDMDRAARFYGEVLDWPLRFRDGERWVQYQLDGVTVALAAADESGVQPGQNAVMTLEVEDLAKAGERLAAAGVTLGPIRDMGSHGLTADFTDPDGNRIQLYQSPKP